MTVRVVKFGGSLLDAEGVRESLRAWMQNQEPGKHIFVCGGGKIVDSIREWQSRFELDDPFCHWMSIRAMSLTAQLLHQVLPDSTLTSDINELRSPGIRFFIFDSAKWLRDEETLPRSWSVTSDSIAAAVAQSLGADELVLLKSSLPQCGRHDLEQLSASGFTDQEFAVVAAGLPRLRIVNLRVPDAEIDLVPDRKQATL